MPSTTPLGEFEVLVIMAVLHGGEDAYGSSIRDDIEARTGRDVSRGAVYITLDRLEEKGFLTSEMGGATAERGGRTKRLFQATPAGVEAVRHAMNVMARMADGLEPVLGTPNGKPGRASR